jgi:hypothetical protein
MADVFSYRLLIPTRHGYKVPPGLKVFADEVSLLSKVTLGDVGRALSLYKTYYLRYCMFWWNRYHHMYIIRYWMPALYQSFLLPRKPMEYFCKFLSYLSK